MTKEIKGKFLLKIKEDHYWGPISVTPYYKTLSGAKRARDRCSKQYANFQFKVVEVDIKETRIEGH